MKSIVDRFFKKKIDFDPNEPEFIQNPYKYYEVLRKKDPIHKSSSAYWVISNYQDVVDALSNDKLSNAPSPYSILNKKKRSLIYSPQSIVCVMWPSVFSCV